MNKIQIYEQLTKYLDDDLAEKIMQMSESSDYIYTYLDELVRFIETYKTSRDVDFWTSPFIISILNAMVFEESKGK